MWLPETSFLLFLYLLHFLRPIRALEWKVIVEWGEDSVRRDYLKSLPHISKFNRILGAGCWNFRKILRFGKSPGVLQF